MLGVLEFPKSAQAATLYAELNISPYVAFPVSVNEPTPAVRFVATTRDAFTPVGKTHLYRQQFSGRTPDRQLTG